MMKTIAECGKIMIQNNPGYYSEIAYDFGDFFVFVPVPIFDRDKYTHRSSSFPAVRKDNGKSFVYDVASDISAAKKAKKVSVPSIMVEPISKMTK